MSGEHTEQERTLNPNEVETPVQEPTTEPTEEDDIQALRASTKQLIILDYLPLQFIPRIELERTVNG